MWWRLGIIFALICNASALGTMLIVGGQPPEGIDWLILLSPWLALGFGYLVCRAFAAKR